MENNENGKKYYAVKIIIVGEHNVGKTNIISRFADDESNNKVTIGVDYYKYNLEYKNKIFQLTLWDTAGQEKFRAIIKDYYINCSFAIIVYDITDKKSFESVEHWVKDCKNNGNKNMHIVLLGNKIDLENERKVSTEEGQNLANSFNMDFFEISAKTGENIENIFEKICEFISDNIDAGNYDFDKRNCGITILENIEEEELKVNKSFNAINLENVKGNKNRNSVRKKKCCK